MPRGAVPIEGDVLEALEATLLLLKEQLQALREARLGRERPALHVVPPPLHDAPDGNGRSG
jgi:hypothetical protein